MSNTHLTPAGVAVEVTAELFLGSPAQVVRVAGDPTTRAMVVDGSRMSTVYRFAVDPLDQPAPTVLPTEEAFHVALAWVDRPQG